VLEAGSLVLDPATRTCARGDVEIRLTAREFSLLEDLLRRNGLVAPKQELLDAVWGFDFPGDPNIVEVYVRYLRRKIDEPFGLNTLQTVRGVGYRVVNDAQ
jgi:DNA-binding response OmpR family regulator